MLVFPAETSVKGGLRPPPQAVETLDPRFGPKRMSSKRSRPLQGHLICI
jgi:hypothetical protein